MQLLCLPLIFSLGMCPNDPPDTAPNGAIEACLTREARDVAPMSTWKVPHKLQLFSVPTKSDLREIALSLLR
jgi:hypothetical protein